MLVPLGLHDRLRFLVLTGVTLVLLLLALLLQGKLMFGSGMLEPLGPATPIAALLVLGMLLALVPGRLLALVPGMLLALVPGRLLALVPGRLLALVPGKLLALVPAMFPSYTPNEMDPSALVASSRIAGGSGSVGT